MGVRGGESRLPTVWKEAAGDLGLKIVTPFELDLPSGARIRVPLMVRHFGAREGMLVLSDYSLVSAWIDEIGQAGYGFSTLSEPRTDEVYSREEYIEVLMDWGWTGAEGERPTWCDRVDPETT